MHTSQRLHLVYLILQHTVALVEIVLVSTVTKVFGTAEAVIAAILLLALHRRIVLVQMLKSLISWQFRLRMVALFAVAIWIWILLFTPLLSFVGLPRSDYSIFGEMQGNFTLLIFNLLKVWTAVAFGEEILGRVFLIDRFEAVFKGLPGATYLTVILASVLFGMAHAYQGIGGVVQASILAVFLSIIYLHQKRSIWTNVVLHGTVDTIAMLLVFFGVKFV